MKKFIAVLLPGAVTLMPLVANAQLGGIGDLIAQVKMLVPGVIALLAGIALLVFFWGLVKFISKAGSEDAKEEGKRIMMWGLIALFVMISVWGIVRFIQTALLNGADYSAPPVPVI